MGVLCLLFDKRKRYSSLLTDVFSITGHGLILAFEENKGIELAKVALPEVVLLPLEDINFWFKLLELGIFPSPVFFVEKQEDIELMRKYGLRDTNCVVLPFNPIELLTRAVALSKEPKDSIYMEAVGPTSVLLKLIRLGATASLTIEGSERSCSIYIKEGAIAGSSCNTEDLLRLLSEDVGLKVESYEGYAPTMKQRLSGNWSFFSFLKDRYISEVPPVYVPKEVAPTTKGIDLDQPVELAEGFYWVGIYDKEGLFQKNAYLRIYGKENIKVPLLINLGGHQDYIIVRTKLEVIVSSISSIKGVVLLGSGVDEASGIIDFLQANQRALVITSASIAQRLRSIGIPQARIRTIETLPDGQLKLASGEVLKFIPTPFLPEPGSFVLFEEGRGYLFTGRFLSSISTPEEFNPLGSARLEDILVYTKLMVPSEEFLRPFLKKAELRGTLSLYPMFGNPVLSEKDISALFSRLEGLTPSAPQSYDKKLLLDICEGLINTLKNSMEKAEFESLLEELSQFVYLENGRIVQLFVEADTLPSLMLAVMHSKRVRARYIKEAITQFHASGIPFTI